MKAVIFILSAALALLNGAAYLNLLSVDPSWLVIASAVGGLLLFIAALLKPERPVATYVAPAAGPAQPRAEAEVVAFLALLQEKGRLVDFVKEEIAQATDEQVGAAARVIHEGCRKAILESFEIAPIRTEAEGATLQLDAGFDTAAYRLLGSVPETPPYRGALVHPGWEVRSVKLPKVVLPARKQWPVLAPAEVEVRKG